MPLFRKPVEFRFPDPKEDRVAVVGTTGSGKSTFALWLLAESADFHKKPWVLVDYKGERIIQRLVSNKDAERISVRSDPPRTPGLYVLTPDPSEMELMAQWLWKVWRRGKIGLFFDEVTMVPNFRGEADTGGPLQSILNQGRSKEIPLYALAQRPSKVNLSIFTEAQFISEFYLMRKEDRERVLSYVPSEDEKFAAQNKNWTLAEHWSLWFDAKRRKSFILHASPPANQVLDIFSARVYREVHAKIA